MTDAEKVRERPISTWCVELNVDCPKCGDYVDVSMSAGFPGPDGPEVCEPCVGLPVQCPTCEHRFEVDCEW